MTRSHQAILAHEIGFMSDNELEPAESTQDSDISLPEQMAELDSTPHLMKDFNLNGPANQQVDINEEDRVQALPKVISYPGITNWFIFPSTTSKLWHRVDSFL